MPYKSREDRRKQSKRWREANKEYYRKWREDNSRRCRDRHLKNTYGIAIEDYEMQLAKQENVCAICERPQQNARIKSLCVDHNKNTGALRELLCDNCNKGIGNFGEDTARMQRAIEYLEKHRKYPNTAFGYLGPPSPPRHKQPPRHCTVCGHPVIAGECTAKEIHPLVQRDRSVLNGIGTPGSDRDALDM